MAGKAGKEVRREKEKTAKSEKLEVKSFVT